ncbi:MAG: formate-dependent phosphoribosylglycinamide formyltransferase [Succinivibrionaceae bacterium]|nr:formate-dependent phosphoribosylglycinamide formyltransferase [Succinivibrionaceae bacterium]
MIGTPYCSKATKAVLLGSGELGKEIAIELQRLGVEVIAVDRYEHAPAMHIAHKSYVIDMLNDQALEQLLNEIKPDYVIPEIEAIATNTLVKLEQQGMHIVPCSQATLITMDREKIRTLSAETLGLKTSKYVFADSQEEFEAGVKKIGIPCVVKPVMSSSGKGQSVIKDESQILAAWKYAHEEGRGKKNKVIIEEFLKFDYEITQLTVNAVDGIHFCEPIGHRQEDGDYRESWQPRQMPEQIKKKAQEIAGTIVKALGGYGIFGVELFVCGDEVIFSEVSPRPHDTGLVTLISQNLSEFALHVRAILGLPIGTIKQYGYCASAVILGDGTSKDLTYDNINDALSAFSNSQIRLFGKPEINGHRRLGVALAMGDSIEEAVAGAKAVADRVTISYNG